MNFLLFIFLRIGTKVTTLFPPFIVWKLCCVLHVCTCDMMVFAAVIVVGLIVSCDIYVSECIAYRSMHVNKHSKLSVILFFVCVIRM